MMIVIDKTPFISDLENDFLSWQRSYDGYSDWEFSLAYSWWFKW